MEGLEGAAHVTSRPSPIAHQLYQAQQAMGTPVTAFPAFDVERQQLEQAASNACQACAACGQACHQARLWIVNTPKVENRPQYVRPKLSKNVARALFWYTAFPSAICSGSQRLPRFVPTCWGKGRCLSPFSRRFLAHPRGRQRLAVCLHGRLLLQGNAFLVFGNLLRIHQISVQWSDKSNDLFPTRNGAVSISTVCQTRKFLDIVYLR